MSSAVGQNALTPWGEQTSLTLKGNNSMHFRLACDQAVLLETAAICEPAGVK